MIYAAQLDRQRALLTFLADACCDGDPSSCGDLPPLFDTLHGDRPDERGAGAPR